MNLWSSRKGAIETEWINAIIIVININIFPLFDKHHRLKYCVQLDCTMHPPLKEMLLPLSGIAWILIKLKLLELFSYDWKRN